MNDSSSVDPCRHCLRNTFSFLDLSGSRWATRQMRLSGCKALPVRHDFPVAPCHPSDVAILPVYPSCVKLRLCEVQFSAKEVLALPCFLCMLSAPARVLHAPGRAPLRCAARVPAPARTPLRRAARAPACSPREWRNRCEECMI